jgi:DNA polymerase-3 subunit gamma/tau
VTSQVLYRKWRPQRLDEVVGQSPITRTLGHAIATGKVAHAYLFCGPRGTGKTSTARILAKAINCLDRQGSEPCNKCHLCIDVNEGEGLDVIELDAASHRRIDDIRNLRERVYYSPTQGKYKTYIIDEVHMLTQEAFNALLKTLEEPPPHVVFVLATTDPQMMPPTVISRCQRFDFRRIPQGEIVKRLEQICNGEEIEVEQRALEIIARSVSGSLRDASNIMEQTIVSFGSPIQANHVRELLGSGDDEIALQVVRCALEGNVKEGLLSLTNACSDGIDLRRFHRNMIDYLRAILLLKSNSSALVDYPPVIQEELISMVKAHQLSQIYRVLKVLAQTNLRQEDPSPLNLELALIECSLELEQAPSAQPSEETISHGRIQSTKLPEPSIPPDEASTFPEAEIPGEHLESLATDSSVTKEQWNALLKALKGQKVKRYSLDGLLRDAKSQVRENNSLILGYRSRSNMERLQEEMADPAARQLVTEAIRQILGVSLEVQPVLIQQEEDLQQGHLVRSAQRLGGRLINEENEIRSTGDEE